MKETTAIYNIISPANIRPGMIPAKKRCPIEMLVKIPQTTINKLGGINIPKQALPLIKPREKWDSYPPLFICG